MPVNIDVFGFKCFSQLKNGENFDKNLSDFTTNLVGNVGEKVRVTFTFNISQTSSTQGLEEWELVPSIKQIRRQTGSFIDDRIQIGDRYVFYPDWTVFLNGSGVAEYNGIVEFISSDGKTLEYSLASGTDTTAGPQTNVGIVFDQQNPENVNTALFHKFGLIGNSETFNYTSKTTENLQVYYAGGLSQGNTNTAQSLGSIKDWVTGSLSVEFTNEVPVPFGAQYIIVHDFIINPFYILSYREFIDKGTIPPLFGGDESIKYAAEIELRKTLSNTGSSKTESFDGLNGFVGWFGENFNGLNTDYKIESVSYEDVGTTDTLEGVNINASTKATITVSKISGNITNYSCGVYLVRLPNSEQEYIGTDTDLLDNFIFKSEIVSNPDTTTANVVTSLVSGNLVIEYTIDYTISERLRLSTDDEYMLFVQVENPSFSSGNSDRVSLIADLRNYTDVDYVSQFIDVFNYGFLQHGKNLAVGGIGGTTLNTSNEDGILLNATIGADTSRNVIINSVKAELIAFNPVENKSFNLDSYNFNIGPTIISSGQQEIIVNTTRGYPLPIGDDFNLVKIETEGLDGIYQKFSIKFAQKIKWQDWILNTVVDSVFFDSNQPNNNLNNKSSNYSEKEGYEIRLSLIVNVSGKDDLGRTVTGDFVNYGGIITVKDYDESEDAVTGVIETFDPESGNPIDGNILYNGKDTLVRATFSNAGSMEWAITRIEVSQSQGDAIFEMSSVYLPDLNTNILKPITGEDKLKFDISGSTLVTECLIDGNKIQEGVSYKLSARTSNNPIRFDNAYALYTEPLDNVSNSLNIQKIFASNVGDINPDQDWTIEFRMKKTGLSTSGNPGFFAIQAGGVSLRIFQLNGQLFVQYIPLEGLAQRNQYFGALSGGVNDQWIHICFVWEHGNNFRIYANGSKTVNSPNGVGGNPTVIEFRNNVTSYITINGILDGNSTNNDGWYRGFRYYQGIAASDAEAATLYNSDAKQIQTVPASLSPYLIRQFLLNQIESRRVIDSSLSMKEESLTSGIPPLGWSDTQVVEGGGAWQDVTNE